MRQLDKKAGAETGATMASKRIHMTWGKALFLICSFAFFVLAGSASAMRETASATPTVVTDKADYSPGSAVTLTGANWGADEAVHINVNDDVGQAWRLDADVTASAEGNFTYQFQLPDFFIADYTVTASAASGQVARTTFTDAVNLQFLGKDGAVHGTAATEENLGNVSAGTAVAATCVGGSGGLVVKATGLGGGQSISWAISYVSGYGNNSTLSTPSGRTTISPSSFTQNGNGDQCATLSISTTGLSAGTYHGEFQVAQTAGATANTEFYFFTFTVTASTVNTTTSAANATATFGDAAVSLSASVTPNTVNVGTVTFTVKNGGTTIGTVTSGTVTGGAASASFPLAGVNAGTYTIQAAYSGGTGFNASNNSGQSPAPTLTVNRADQAISFAALGNKTFGDPAFTVSATGGGSGNPVTFGATGNCTSTGTNGATTTVTGAGSCTVTANQAGNTNYNAAAPVSRTFSIAKASQSIMITTHAPASRVFGQSFTVAATGGGSGNAVTFSSAGGCTNVGDTFTMTSGTTDCTVMYDQAGNANYEAASQLTETVDAEKASQSITITTHAPASRVFGQSFTVAATASSGLSVSFDSAGGCSNSGDTFTMTSGTTDCTAKYDQAGNNNYEAAPQLTQTVDAEKASQSITITTHAPASKVYGGSFTVAATGGGSGNPVVFSSSGVCSNSGATFTMMSGTGNCVVHYDQAGNANYNDAPEKTDTVAAEKETLTVTAEDKTITFGDAPGAFAVSYDGFVGSDGPGSLGGTLAFSFAGKPPTSYGPSDVTPTNAGAYAVRPGGLASDNYAFVYKGNTFTIDKADQVISITTHAPASKVYGGSFTVAATGGGSGNAVSFSSSGGCSNIGATFTMTSGTTDCTVRYDQAGNGNYNPAPQLTETVDAEKAEQDALSVTSPDDGTYDQSYDIVTSGGSGTGTLTFDVGSSTACSIVSGKLKLTSGTGGCAVTAHKAGDDNYNPVTSGAHAVTVHKANQAPLNVTSPSDGTYDQSYDIVTSGGSGSGALSFDVGSSSACAIVAGKLKITSGTGSCAVSATKAADDNYNETTSPAHAVTVHKADQTISFVAPANRKLGDADFVVTATASSGLAVSFASQTTGTCTMSGSTVHIVTVGTCTIRASQAGNSNYNAAPNVDRSVSITYVFHGFFQPVDNDKWNAAQAGSAIPVKFDLSGNQGLNIFAAGYPKVTLVTCPTASTPVDSIEETVAATNSGLQYDSTVNPPIGQYIYVWKTDKAWASTCRQLDVKFVDGTMFSARFQFKK
jgi:hypothetical protein